MTPLTRTFLAAFGLATLAVSSPAAESTKPSIHAYRLSDDDTGAGDGTPASYDEAMAAACLQGLINRDAPEVYLLAKNNTRPQYWLDLLSKDGRWLEGREVREVATLDDLRTLAGEKLKGAVIWDPEVPATVNVASTIAGVHDGVVLSPEFAGKYLVKWNIPVIKDLRGMFTGAETGSKKNDAYRWAIREYLAKGLCSNHRVFLFEDAYYTRPRGDIGYAIPRDWIIKNRAFVFDLSPWGDEAPSDDKDQKLGLDLETYHMVLKELFRHSEGKHMIELVGFFAFKKYSNAEGNVSKHDPVPTELESVWLISPYNIYKSSISAGAYNQSFHSQAPRQPLKQNPAPPRDGPVEGKTYICVGMADYDSGTLLYDFLPKYWDDAGRGKIPLLWGVNPNLVETYPDVMAYFYSTATPADTFASDANAAGYIAPNSIKPQFLPLFVEHNKKFFEETDMTIAPMIIDFDQPTPAVKNAFREFAPDGIGSVVCDTHGNNGQPPEPHVWKGMPVMEMINDASASYGEGFRFIGAEKLATIMSKSITARGNKQPGFYMYRITWITPTNMMDTIAALRKMRPDLDIEVLDPGTFMKLFRKHYDRKISQNEILGRGEGNMVVADRSHEQTPFKEESR